MKRLVISLLLLLCGGVKAQQLINCATNTPCTTLGPQNTTTGDAAYLGGGKINANFKQLYGFFDGQLYVLASGDISGATDTANLNAAISTLAGNTRLPPLASSLFTGSRIVLGPKTFYLTSGNINVLGPSNNSKIQGFWLQGQGRDVTSIDYNPAISAPLFVNNHGLNVKISDISFIGHDANSDFLWSQEQAGLSNIQDYTFTDVGYQGSWSTLWRLTGGNNNSEWKFSRISVGANVTNGVYVPPPLPTSISNGSSTITATNTAEQAVVGDTGSFSASVAPMTTGVTYFVVSATNTGFQVSATNGGAPITFAATGTPTFTTGSDQFLNFWFDKVKWWTGSSAGQWINMSLGGSIKIRDSDMSAHAPSQVAYAFNLLGISHNKGVQNFEVDGLRVEHSGNNSRLIHSQWAGGSISFNNLDESSQAGSRLITNAYALYENVNTPGPTVTYTNSQLMGVHNYVNSSSNSHFQSEILYQSVSLLDNPTAANFITITNNGNSGGFPRIRFDKSRNLLDSNIVGYREIVDTDINWNTIAGGQSVIKSVACVGSNSDWSFNGGSFQIRLPMNAWLMGVRYSNPSGSGAGGAYNYSIQTSDGSVTLLTVSGANASTPVPVTAQLVSTQVPLVMSSDALRTIKITDVAVRAGIFTGPQCFLDYIG